MKEYPFFETVPRGFAENIQWRLRVGEKARRDQKVQASLLEMCRQDLLFWITGFCWLYEPRPRRDDKGNELPKYIPFIPWEHQINPIKLVDEIIGYEDLGAEKSRGEGASWIACMVSLHRWMFVKGTAIGLVSRTEAAVDNADDPDSLMWKLDFELEKLPAWMAGVRDRDWTRNQARHVLRNLRNDSTITGYAATGDVASGGRKTFFIMDELAKFPRGPDQEAMNSTGPVTESRFIISTPKGQDGAYYQLMNSDVAMTKIILDWKDNPTRNRGMFRIERAEAVKARVLELGTKKSTPAAHKIVPVDPVKYGVPDEKFVTEFFNNDLRRLTDRGFATNDPTKQWSPWYVRQCLRPAATPQSIAQEYDRDYGGSAYRFFNAPKIDQLIISGQRTPKYVGDLQFDSAEPHKAKFLSHPGGCLKIWCDLQNEQHTPRTTEYVVGVDVAGGQGGSKSSNSTMSVVDRVTGIKVAEYASPVCPPERLADYAVALCLFFGGRSKQAFLIWEDNGYGSMFRNRIFETSFRNFYYRRVTDEASRRVTKKPGWNTNKKTKRELLGAYAHALYEGLFINHSKIALAECKEYQVLLGGRIEHIAAENKDDPSGAGENHGDRVIADALANWVLYEAREGRREQPQPLEAMSRRVPPTSILGIKRAEAAKRKKRDWW